MPCSLSSRTGGVLGAAMLGGCGLFFVWQSLRLDLGHPGLPGPGFVPLSLGVVLLLCASLIGIECTRQREVEAVELGHRDVLITLAALLVLPVVFEPLGALLSLGLFGSAMLVLIGRIAAPVAIAGSALGMAACWYFFEVLLGVSLPPGPW